MSRGRMGRLGNLTTPTSHAGVRHSGRLARSAAAVTVAALLWTLWAVLRTRWAAEISHALQVHAAGGNELVTDWDLIEPNEDLRWVPCFRAFDEFLCTRLTVPLDYNRPLNQSTPLTRPASKLHIALIMLPGKNHPGSGAWSESPLLVNPGGPGGSGTSFVMLAGRNIQTLAGPDLDVIGFDPRGIGATTPQANCFSDMSADAETQSNYERQASRQGSLMRRMLWLAENEVVGLPNTSSTATEQVVFRARGLTKLCNSQDHADSILRHAGTPNVAQDMLSIVQAWNRWISGLAPDLDKTGLKKEPHTVAPRADDADVESLPHSTRGKLVYWGFSYGTILGATFATMFPEHVGRMVLDGVVNSDEWYFENSWVNAPQDLDKVIDRFLLYCYQARQRCHLYRNGDRLEDVRERLESVLNGLIDQPRLYAITGYAPVYLTYSTVKALLFSATYVPATFPTVAIVFDALHRGVDLSSFIPPLDLSPFCQSNPKNVQVRYPDEGGTAVLCTDQRFQLDVTRSGLQKELQKMTDVSSFGDVAFTIASRCVGWDIDRVDPPSMDWAKFPLKDRDPVNTSFPILFVSNTRDPITPIRSGLAQSRKFLDAGFIEQNCEGHCSLSMVSICTVQKIQAYFNKGIVPEKPHFDHAGDPGDGFTGNWTRCEVDQRPWDDPSMESLSNGRYSAEEVEFLRAGKHLHSSLKDAAQFPALPHSFERLMEMEQNEVEDLFMSAVSSGMSRT